MPSSTRWRINMEANSGGSGFVVAEIEMHTSIGGADVCTGGTPTASSYFFSFPVSYAFDDDNSTFWASGNATSAWVEYEFGSAQDIVEFSVRSSASTNLPDTPAVFELQYYNGSAWVTTIRRWAEYGWSLAETRTYSASEPDATKKLWRILVSAVNGATNCAIGEVQMRTTLRGIDQCTGGKATSSSPYDDVAVPSAAFADDGADPYWSAKVENGAWVGYLFSSAKDIVQITIQALEWPDMVYAPKDFKLQYWDGSAWVDSFSVSGETAWASQEIRTFPRSDTIIQLFVQV